MVGFVLELRGWNDSMGILILASTLLLEYLSLSEHFPDCTLKIKLLPIEIHFPVGSVGCAPILG